jgi:predicted nucleic acid-binding protein
MKKLADHDLSFTNCVSFALMKREGIKDAFGFDRDFVDAGLRLWKP